MAEAEYLRRPRCPELDGMLGVPMQVLDKGFIRIVDYMGDEPAIVQAARVSYGEGTKTPSDDRSLIRYLMRHRHTTPFEMCELKLHVKLPIFVARQWIRHRMANVNEASARYSIMSKEFYIPRKGDVQVQSSTNKQGRGWTVGDEQASKFINDLEWLSSAAYASYERSLEDKDDKPGVARELARAMLPVNIYTEWYWKIDLHNLLHFQSLRHDPHAQYEIRKYASCIDDIIHIWVPNVWDAFQSYRVGAHTFSAEEMATIKTLLLGREIPRPENVSDREFKDFERVLGCG